MKKTLILMMALILVLTLTSTVYAAEPPNPKITVMVQPIDYAAAKTGVVIPVSKNYVQNERFAALVFINIPAFMDSAGLALEVSPKGCIIEDMGTLALENGSHIITGTVITPGATIKVTVKDKATDQSNTINEYWIAYYNDRTVSATATLGLIESSDTAAPSRPVGIPKTGSRAEIGGAALCLLLAVALMRRRKHA